MADVIGLVGWLVGYGLVARRNIENPCSPAYELERVESRCRPSQLELEAVTLWGAVYAPPATTLLNMDPAEARWVIWVVQQRGEPFPNCTGGSGKVSPRCWLEPAVCASRPPLCSPPLPPLHWS